MDESKYRKLDIIIKIVIAFFLMCLLFASYGIKTEIHKLYFECPSSITVDNRSYSPLDVRLVR